VTFTQFADTLLTVTGLFAFGVMVWSAWRDPNGQ
jgi:hypothetical protein